MDKFKFNDKNTMTPANIHEKDRKERLRQIIESCEDVSVTNEGAESLLKKLEQEFLINDEPPAKAVIEVMQDELVDIHQALEKLREMGFSMELMEIFIYKKTKVNLTEVRAVLKSQRAFLKEAFKPVEGD